jgi:hypothetical protein
MAEDAAPPGKDQLVAAYKRILQTSLDRRPSGTRQRIAEALGKHKSFVSQITNPAYSVPIPARHVTAILELCHFSAEERRAFLEAYVQAHPSRRQALKPTARGGAPHVLHIPVPTFEDQELQREVEDLIRAFAARVVQLVQKR